MKYVKLYIGEAAQWSLKYKINTDAQLLIFPENFLCAADCAQLVLNMLKRDSNLIVFTNSASVIDLISECSEIKTFGDIELIVQYQKYDENGHIDFMLDEIKQCVDGSGKPVNPNNRLLELWFIDHNRVYNIIHGLDADSRDAE